MKQAKPKFTKVCEPGLNLIYSPCILFYVFDLEIIPKSNKNSEDMKTEIKAKCMLKPKLLSFDF